MSSDLPYFPTFKTGLVKEKHVAESNHIICFEIFVFLKHVFNKIITRRTQKRNLKL